MLKNYFKIALRALRKNRVYSVINITGLGIGIAVCLMIFLWVRNEVSYDKFNTNAENIYRVVWSDNIPRVGVPISNTLSREFPQVIRTTNLMKGKLVIKKDDQFIEQDNVIYTDENYFKVFTVKFISGNPENALTEPGSILLTKETDDKYFPGINPVGKTITDNSGKLHKVTGVVDKFPAQSHFHFTMLAPLTDLNYFQRRKEQWLSGTVYTYALLKNGANPAVISKGLEKYLGQNVLKDASDRIKKFNKFSLQRLTDIHLKSDLIYELEPNGNITYVYTFSIIAFFILLLAIVNFTNLATARSIDRLSEIGVRKVLGSNRKQLITQFLSETFVQVSLAFSIALIAVELTLRKFNDFAGTQLNLNLFSNWTLDLYIIIGILTLSIIAGAYPALYLSGFKPISVLKKQINLKGGKRGLRKGLVIFQFVVSNCLIAGTLIVFKQMGFIRDKNLGFDKEHVLVVKNAGSLLNHYKEFRNNLLSNPSIADASLSMYLPGDDFDSMLFDPEQPANIKQTSITYDMIDDHFVNVLKLKIVKGRNFSSKLATDHSAFLVNEAAVKKFGWKNPVGKYLSFGNVKGKIVGVVQDFNYMSLRSSISPIIFPYIRWTPKYVSIRISQGRIRDNVNFVKTMWNKFVPDRPFTYSFLDQNYDALYKSETKMSELFTLFSVLAIFIASLGLLGLASFNVKKRTKEIGIRKILGASSFNILFLLSKEFLAMVIMANIIDAPIAWYAMNRWLHGFAYRISLNASFFIVTCLLSAAIALFVITIQAIKATTDNPVNSIRYE